MTDNKSTRMISFIRGKIKYKFKNSVIVEVKDIGYQVFVAPTLLADAAVDQEIELHTHQHVREDCISLYGFSSLDELRIFEDLISVSGIGPKSALGVLAIASANEIEEAVERGDPGLLIKVSGIGKKSAQRIVLELKGKIIRDVDFTASDEDREVVSALVGLGYKERVAREAVRKLPAKRGVIGDRIKEALRIASGG